MNHPHRALISAGLAACLVLAGCTGQHGPAGHRAPPSGTRATAAGSATAEPGATSATGTKPATGRPIAERPETIASGLQAPWSVAFAQNTPLVSERDSGRILELGADGGTRTVGTIDGVEASGEAGLLGITVQGSRLYAYYTAADGNRIVGYTLTGEPGGFRLGRPSTLVDGIPAAGNHNGGRLAFGPDGMLYATTGDAGDRPNAQNRESLAGKILRMTPDGGVPKDNPFADSLVYTLGHRNPQGIAWDAKGAMYASEFGQDDWDELNAIEAGANYGWPTVEGAAKRKGFTDPIAQWKPSEASPSGMAISGGTAYIANLRGERLRTVELADPKQQHEYFVGEHGRLRDVVSAPAGGLWAVTNNTDGRGSPGRGDDRILEVQPGGQ
ncbi:PQQ-dependent sugar dehydrogenase [Brevibacterium sp. 91QC2O2]|jgi:glucose/arabinose dehydrogenase|uniref:PQQ-dependent sugar dehydrogenase n=1 Tax=Brevibacterium sp. 91QC2O2 TaxID=2968458 RepID=UPI00211C10EA|nr:PQQ-dependent sugar dehydrogenase [Brevibacterium sp. 91QC2O2]MCQ9367231.1 PQQ-dependent sugar dehydrogenase [Brevibacterium sp. 91QC2O2]